MKIKTSIKRERVEVNKEVEKGAKYCDVLIGKGQTTSEEFLDKLVCGIYSVKNKNIVRWDKIW